MINKENLRVLFILVILLASKQCYCASRSYILLAQSYISATPKFRWEFPTVIASKAKQSRKNDLIVWFATAPLAPRNDEAKDIE